MTRITLKTAALVFAPALAAAHPAGNTSERVSAPQWTRNFEVLSLGPVCAITKFSGGNREHYEIVEQSLVMTRDRRFSLRVGAPFCHVTHQATGVSCSYERGREATPVCTRPRRAG